MCNMEWQVVHDKYEAMTNDTLLAQRDVAIAERDAAIAERDALSKKLEVAYSALIQAVSGRFDEFPPELLPMLAECPGVIGDVVSKMSRENAARAFLWHDGNAEIERAVISRIACLEEATDLARRSNAKTLERLVALWSTRPSHKVWLGQLLVYAIERGDTELATRIESHVTWRWALHRSAEKYPDVFPAVVAQYSQRATAEDWGEVFAFAVANNACTETLSAIEAQGPDYYTALMVMFENDLCKFDEDAISALVSKASPTDRGRALGIVTLDEDCYDEVPVILLKSSDVDYDAALMSAVTADCTCVDRLAALVVKASKPGVGRALVRAIGEGKEAVADVLRAAFNRA